MFINYFRSYFLKSLTPYVRNFFSTLNVQGSQNVFHSDSYF